MSRRAVPKGEFRDAKHGGCLINRRAAPKAHTAVRGTGVA